MARQAQIIELIQISYDAMLRFAYDFAVEETALSTSEHWSTKDTLAHIGEWQRRGAKRIASARRGEATQEPDDLDETNREIYQAYSHFTWEEVLALLDRSRQELLEQTQALADEELNDASFLHPLSGRPPWWYIILDGFSHPLVHLAEAYLHNGDRETAEELWQQQAKELATLDTSKNWQGRVLYNLACYYLQMDDKEKALEQLERALNLNPTLIHSSQQDPDLAALHGDPEFEEMLHRLNPAEAAPQA